jgi:hypothetical protein
MLVQKKQESCQEANSIIPYPQRVKVECFRLKKPLEYEVSVSPTFREVKNTRFELREVKQRRCNVAISILPYLQRVKVDSLKLRIPLEDVSIVSTTFREKYQKLYVTGELDECFSLEQHKTNITNGITARIGIVSHLVTQHTSKEFIYIQANSKMCKGRYLEGITLDTVKCVYDYIISLKVVYFTYEVFLDSFVSDIDLAYDVDISVSDMISMNQAIYSTVKVNMVRHMDKPFRSSDNVGLQFNRREKATPSAPFIKIYHKGLEMAHKSKEFYDEYLSMFDLSRYGRIEFTIKGAKHQSHLGISIKTLRQLLEYDRLFLDNLVLEAIPKNYIEKRVVIKMNKESSYMDKMLLFCMNELIASGRDKRDLYSMLSQFGGDSAKERMEKSRVKKKIDAILSQIDSSEQLDKNERVRNVMRILRLDV